MKHLRRSLGRVGRVGRVGRLAVPALALALAACGGKSTGKGTSPHGHGVPFDQEAVKALMAATAVAGLPNCEAEGASTIEDTMRVQRLAMAADAPIDETFTCAPNTKTQPQWACTWAIEQKIAAPGDRPDEPSAGIDVAFQVIGQVNADGVLIPGQLVCVGPG
ncbi:MAG TPA: hypothetical protein VHE35_33835 [Kofleriaceae bacterium]|nr:hypothetical protein [Kofleriaceae bacterium]